MKVSQRQAASAAVPLTLRLYYPEPRRGEAGASEGARRPILKPNKGARIYILGGREPLPAPKMASSKHSTFYTIKKSCCVSVSAKPTRITVSCSVPTIVSPAPLVEILRSLKLWTPVM